MFCACTFICSVAFSQAKISFSALTPKMNGQEISIVSYDGFKTDTVKRLKIEKELVQFTLSKSGFYRCVFGNTFSFPFLFDNQDIVFGLSTLNYPDQISCDENKLLIDILMWEETQIKKHFFKVSKTNLDLLEFRLKIEKRIKEISKPKIRIYLWAEYYSNPYWFPLSSLNVVDYKNELTSILSQNISYLKDTDLIRLFGLRMRWLNYDLTETKSQFRSMNKTDLKIWCQIGIINKNNILAFNQFFSRVNF